MEQVSRKKRKTGDPTSAAAAAILQKDWGIAEVLAECGATLLPDDESSTTTQQQHSLGCELDANVTPSALRASVHALLREMDRNGIDPNNERVLRSLEEMISTGTVGGGDDDGDDKNASGGSKHSLLKRMLLPTYRVVPAPAGGSGSAAKKLDLDRTNAPKDKENVGNEQRPGDHPTTPRTPGSNDVAFAGNKSGVTVLGDGRAVQTFDSSSLVRTLLRVDALQSKLLTALVQKLPEFATEEEEDQEDEEMEEVDPEATEDPNAILDSTMKNAGASSVVDKEQAAADREEIPRLILSQIRWLDHVVVAATLTEVCLEVLTFLTSSSGDSPGDLARTIILDLIATLPDIVDETKTVLIDSIVSTLTDVRNEDSSLLIPCLDALSSLRLSPEQLRGVTMDALTSLQTADIWCLPAVCKFLVQNAPATMCEDVVEALREMRLGGIDGDEEDHGLVAAVATGAGGADGRPGSGGGGRRRRRGGANESTGNNSNDGQVLLRADAECLMLESFAQGMQYRPDLSLALMNKIKKTPSTDHLASDIWLLLCCAVAPHNKSQVKTIFRSKAASGGFTPDLIGEAIRGNGRALSHLFTTSILDLADGLVRSPEAEARGLGGFLYSEMFEEFHDPVQRQEIVGSLVTHVASGGSSDEIDSAMKVFSRIVEGNSRVGCGGTADGADAASSLRPFRPYLSSLLDYVRSMSSSQLRRLFMVLFTVGGNDDDGDDDMGGPRKVGVGGCDDVQIVIRKYLAMPPAFLKRIGIIGAVAYAVSGSVSISEEDFDPEATELEEGSEDQAASLSAAATDVINMLNSVRDSCGGGTQNAFGADPDEANGDTALALFLDELCLAVRGGRLAGPVKAWILDNFQGALEEFLGDLSDPTESEPSEGMESQMVIDDPSDRAIVTGTSGNRRSPRGALRFNIDEEDAVVYVKFLSLAASDDPVARSSLTQLCPLLRLLATCHDTRYGGVGLGEIDAVVGCPLFLPSTEVCSCEGFYDLFPDQQLSATMSSFYAASWCRELVNTFVHSAAFPLGADTDLATAPDESSQNGSDPQELRTKLIDKIKALIEIQEDLKFCSSKAPQFAPPGLAPFMPPKELNDLQRIIDEEYDSDDDMGFASDKEREKEIKRRTKIKDKAKNKLAKARKKYEESLSERTLGALRPISSLACLALGFPECSVIDAAPGASQALSMCAGEMRKLKVGGPVETLLFSQLKQTIDGIFPKKKISWLKTSSGGSTGDDDEQSIDNPYAGQTSQPNKQSVGGEKFKTLDEFLAGYVFGGLYEHMATIAEIRGGADTEEDDEDEIDRNGENLLRCTSIIFACVRSLLDAEPLTASARGRKYLEQIMKQMTTGDRTVSYEVGDRTPFSLPSLRKGLSEGFTMIEEMVMGGETDDLAFAMEGVETLEAFLHCALRVETALGNSSKGTDEPAEIQGLRKRLSEICHKLLRRTWSDDAKYNKSTVGKLVTLYIDFSCSVIPSNIDQATTVDTMSIGRLNALSTIVNDMLVELSNTEDCKGPVDAYPTCSSQSFGTLFSAVLNFIPNELAFIHASPLASSNKTAHKTLEYDLRLIELFCDLFELTKENSELAKKPHLLSQLKAGTAFLHTFNTKAVKFLEKNFQDNQKSSIEIIRAVQKMTLQMGNVISYAKREKDSALIKETPRAKRLMEAFLHKIKVLMRKNNCITAIWQGNLKNKNIDGTVFEDNEEEEEGSGEENEEDEDGTDDEEDSEEEGGDEEEDDESEEDEE